MSICEVFSVKLRAFHPTSTSVFLSLPVFMSSAQIPCDASRKLYEICYVGLEKRKR